MKLGLLFAVGFAASLHLAFVLFGGIFFLGDGDGQEGRLQQVELLAEEEEKDEEEEKGPETAEETTEDELQAEEEQPPNAEEMMRNLDLSVAEQAPALEAASLSAIEAALRGEALAGGDFAQSVDFSSGGRIGGTGKAGIAEGVLEGAFSLGEIDQKPRAVFQSEPIYPSEMRGKKVEGVVSVAFIVDASGKVDRPRIEQSTHPAFERPALDAVKQWRFEPAVKGGQRVSCKMRVPIRFQPKGTS